jgi:para-nitrobenzyl esterase
MSETLVQTTAGTVRGRVEDGVAVFRGIPFAAPPVGPHRFQAPAPAQPWDGVREADAFGPPPPQSRPGPQPAGPAGPVRHEPTDWLTLNVWTTDPGAAGLPVMVWIYGGAYRFGSSAEPDCDGATLARAGVVLVSANHRVGVDGYAQLDGAPANRGLLDIVATLRWVRENIAAFGGDPDRVTIFGESAGGGAVASLLVMPAARGLFHRAVAQSVPGTFFGPSLARDITTELLMPLGLEPTADALRDVAPERLLDALSALDARMPSIERWGFIGGTPTPFSPVVDGDVLPIDPWAGLAAGTAKEVPLLVGSNRDEWRLWLLLRDPLDAVTDELADETMTAFGPGPARMRAAYPDASAQELYTIARSDRMFRIPSLHLARAQTVGGGRAYHYELTWPSPVFDGMLGACHGLDVPLVFGSPTQGLAGALLGTPPTADAVEVGGQMRAAWTAFARDGDPGWPAYDDDQRLTRVFDIGERGGVRAYPEEASYQLWAGTAIEVLDLRR